MRLLSRGVASAGRSASQCWSRWGGAEAGLASNSSPAAADNAASSSGRGNGSSHAHMEVVLALGTNQGNRVSHLLGALKQMPAYGVEVLRVSLLYETAPMHVTDQAPYLNAAVLARTDLNPFQLLYNMKQIEKAAGRDLVGGQRHGPRPLDLDIVFYGSQQVAHETLCIPHERWHERPFVKAPLVDLLQPRDEAAGYIAERGDPASVLPQLQRAAESWQRDGGQAQVGRTGLVRVLPIQRQIWELGTSTHVMGILNMTPDSFSEGTGKVMGVAHAVEAARAMVDAGASVVDVGGQSTRPGSARLSPADEAARVLPVIKALREDSQLVHVPVSVDTYYASVARQAVEAGADMVNDVYGGRLDAGMWREVAGLGVPYVLMHMRGDPGTMQSPPHTAYEGGDVVAGVGTELAAAAEGAIAAGVLPWNLVLDPGLGFAKTRPDSVRLLAGLARLRGEALPGVLGRLPMLVGPSRKAFLGALTGHERPEDRDVATVAACTAAVMAGADMVRVHNVAAAADGVAVADALARGLPPEMLPEAAAAAGGAAAAVG